MSALRMIRVNRQKIARVFAGTIAAGAMTGALGASTYWIATREQKFYSLDEANDELLHSAYFKKFNPYQNENISDIYEARVPISQVKSDLIEDFKRGGTKLVERYCSGALGGWGK